MAVVFRHPSLRIKGAPWPAFTLRLAYKATAAAVLGTDLFIATQGASGDTYSDSATGDTYSQGARDDDFTKGGGIA